MLEPEPAKPNRGWETPAVIKAREEAAERANAAANSAGGGGAAGGLNWQQQQQQQQQKDSGHADDKPMSAAAMAAMSSSNMLCGDWICSCGEHNFAKRQRCWKCRGRKTNNVITAAPREKKNSKPGDWACAKVNTAASFNLR